MPELRELLQSPDAAALAELGAHVRARVETSHDGNWFSTQGIMDPHGVEGGSRAGDPWEMSYSPCS